MQHTIFAPAKLNLFLAITGRRPDGFHDLVSVVAPLALGDTVSVDVRVHQATTPRFTVTCTDPLVPCDDTNLVVRAAKVFAEATGWAGAASFHVEKRIPVGAGMGGGSTDGVAALKALNSAAGSPLDAGAMARLAATLGSDCPLFLHDRPVVMRGRGERVAPLSDAAAARLRGRRVLVFKPAFGIPTAWAYRELAAAAAAGAKDAYVAPDQAEARLEGWLRDGNAPVESLLFNNLERPAFAKHVALPAMLEQLRRDFGLAPRLTGSGSACFAFLPEAAPVEEIGRAIRAAWGDSAFIVATHLA